MGEVSGALSDPSKVGQMFEAFEAGKKPDGFGQLTQGFMKGSSAMSNVKDGELAHIGAVGSKISDAFMNKGNKEDDAKRKQQEANAQMIKKQIESQAAKSDHEHTPAGAVHIGLMGGLLTLALLALVLEAILKRVRGPRNQQTQALGEQLIEQKPSGDGEKGESSEGGAAGGSATAAPPTDPK